MQPIFVAEKSDFKFVGFIWTVEVPATPSLAAVTNEQ